MPAQPARGSIPSCSLPLTGFARPLRAGSDPTALARSVQRRPLHLAQFVLAFRPWLFYTAKHPRAPRLPDHF